VQDVALPWARDAVHLWVQDVALPLEQQVRRREGKREKKRGKKRGKNSDNFLLFWKRKLIQIAQVQEEEPQSMVLHQVGEKREREEDRSNKILKIKNNKKKYIFGKM
jgi:hypothetical protein